MKPKQKPHYVNNKQFSQAVVDYVKTVKAADTNCITEGLGHVILM